MEKSATERRSRRRIARRRLQAPPGPQSRHDKAAEEEVQGKRLYRRYGVLKRTRRSAAATTSSGTRASTAAWARMAPADFAGLRVSPTRCARAFLARLRRHGRLRSDIFGDVAGGRAGPRAGQNLQIRLALTLERDRGRRHEEAQAEAPRGHAKPAAARARGRDRSPRRAATAAAPANCATQRSFLGQFVSVTPARTLPRYGTSGHGIRVPRVAVKGVARCRRRSRWTCRPACTRATTSRSPARDTRARKADRPGTSSS